MKMTEIRAVLFDLDDTLVDHTYGLEQALIGLSGWREATKSVSLQKLKLLWAEHFSYYWPLVVGRKMTLYESRFQRIDGVLKALGCEVTEEERHAMTEKYADDYLMNIRLIDGAREMLQKLKESGYVVGIITNTTAEMVREKISRTGIGNHVDFTVSAETVGAQKPDPVIFLEALKISRSDPERTVFIGDSIQADIKGALKAGIKPVWFNRSGQKWTETGFSVPVINDYNPVENVIRIVRTVA